VTDKLITLEHFGSAAEAHAARVELDAAGIRAAVGDDAAAEMLSIMGAGLGGVKLLVFERDAQRAREILQQHQQKKGPVVPAWICHECFSVVDAGFEVCWFCGATYDPQKSQPAPPEEAANDTDETTVEPAGVDEREDTAHTPPLEAGEWRCPGCGLRIGDAYDRCPACDAAPDDPPNPYLSSSTKAEALHPPAPPQPSTNDAEHLVLLAFRGAVLGLVFCPGILHVYSLWLLLRVSLGGEELSPEANRRFYIALAIDLLFGLLLFPYALLSTYNILNAPYYD